MELSLLPSFKITTSLHERPFQVGDKLTLSASTRPDPVPETRFREQTRTSSRSRKRGRVCSLCRLWLKTLTSRIDFSRQSGSQPSVALILSSKEVPETPLLV